MATRGIIHLVCVNVVLLCALALTLSTFWLRERMVRLPRMSVPSAGLLVATGGALALLAHERRRAGILVAGALSISTLLLLRNYAAPGPGEPAWGATARFTSSPHTLFVISLVAVALIFLGSGRRAPIRIAHALALTAAAAAFFAIISQIFLVTQFFRVTPEIGISPFTAISLALLSAGVLCIHPEHSVVRVFFSPGEGARLARRFLPFVLVAPLLVAFVVQLGLIRGWYSEAAGMTLLVLALVLLLGAVTWRYALSVNQAEARLEQLVEERTAQLRESIAQAEEFSHNIAHDVRGPLVNLRRFLDLVLEEHAADLPEPARDYLTRAARAGGRIDHLTAAMLRYNELSRRTFRLEPVELMGVVTEAVTRVRALCGAVPTIDVAGRLGVVVADARAIRDIVAELLANACRFTVAGVSARVTVWTEEANGRVRLCVRDEGIGVPPEQLEKIFQPFERLAAGPPEHTGIGLALVRRAATKMNGRVGALSDGVRGAEFSIELPAARAQRQMC